MSLPVQLSHLQDEHVLPEVVPVLEDDTDGVTAQGGGVGPLELQPQRLLLGRHDFALLDLNTGHICESGPGRAFVRGGIPERSYGVMDGGENGMGGVGWGEGEG